MLPLVSFTSFKCSRRLALPSCCGFYPFSKRPSSHAPFSLPSINVFFKSLLVIVTAFQVSKVMFDHLDSLLVLQISSFLSQLSCKIQRAAYNDDGSHALGALWDRLISNFDRVDAISTSRFLIFQVFCDNCHVSDSTAAYNDDGCIALGGFQTPLYSDLRLVSDCCTANFLNSKFFTVQFTSYTVSDSHSILRLDIITGF